jgi:hypothetical protein
MASKRLEASFLRREKKCLHLRSASYARMCVSPHRFCLLMTSSVKYGMDKSTLPNGVANFFYGPKTENTNLRRHLHQVHSDEYDKVVLLNKWTYKLSTQTRDASTHNARNKLDRQLPSFSPASMMRVNLILNTGLQVSSVIPSGVLAGLFVYCALRTYAGRTFVYLSKTETHESGSMKGPRVANTIQSKFPSYSF